MTMLATRSLANKETIVVVVLFVGVAVAVAFVAHAKSGQRHDAKELALDTMHPLVLDTARNSEEEVSFFYIIKLKNI